MTYLLRLDEPAATDVREAGGKGAALARLKQAGFPVPDGVVVRSQAYLEFAAGAVRAGQRTSGPMRRKTAAPDARAIRQVLAPRPLPRGLATEVARLLSEVGDAEAFAVRSSSTVEDLASGAFAGQYDTYVNRRGLDHILEAVRDCFLSLWSERAIAYRAQHGVDAGREAMAVVIQRMIPCDTAGVAFSIDPVTGDPGEIVIAANFGLGESVVSGISDADHYRLAKPDLTLRECRVAEKTRRIVCAPSGVVEEAIEGPESTSACLEESALHELGRLAQDVEAFAGFPQDMEWGRASGRLYLLQARPVTRIPPRWTRNELAERFPNAMTPLSWDMLSDGLNASLHHCFRLMGVPPFSGEWFSLQRHYVYGNEHARAVYGQALAAILQRGDDPLTAVTRLAERAPWLERLPAEWVRDLDRYLLRLGAFEVQRLGRLSLQGLWDFITAVRDHGVTYFLPNVAISSAHTLVHRILELFVTALLGEDGPGVFADLLAFLETKTSAINRELFELAEEVRRHPNAERLLREVDSREIVARRLLRRHAAVARRFDKLLLDHGHRETDFDAYQPTWNDAPWLVLDHVRAIVQGGMAVSPAEQERAARARVAEGERRLFAVCPDHLRFTAYELLRLTRQYVILDDVEHYQTTRLHTPMRRALVELGTRLVARGLLEDPLDVFFAHFAALAEAVRVATPSAWRALGDAIAAEKAAYLRDRAQAPPWDLGVDAVEEAADHELCGIPASPGQAEGPVCLVMDVSDFAKLAPGAVLVARMTTPTWTPLFYSAAAVVTETGSPLSHGAVVAREMRIPAVMSVRGVLTRLREGQRVRVDGSLGRVYPLAVGEDGEPMETVER